MRRWYLFALFLVIYEFAAYSANDMIMPGMIKVVQEFQATQNYVALSLSLYLLGNCLLTLPAGFLAERFGKRQVLLFGNLFFLTFTVLGIFSHTITEFMLWRFLQGCGLGIIPIGYALIHENFNDKKAIRITALMSNVALLAPLIGPALGSFIVNYHPWEYIFVVTAVISSISLAGLFIYTPNHHKKNTLNLTSSYQQFALILKNRVFIHGVTCIVIAAVPLLLWISQAPNLILYKLHLNYSHYALYQVITISGLLLSTVIMQFIAGRMRITNIIHSGNFLMLFGGCFSFIFTRDLTLITVGLFLNSLGLGLSNACLFRMLMSIKEFPHSFLAALIGFLQTLGFVIGITLVNSISSYFEFSLISFTSAVLIVCLISFFLVLSFAYIYRHRQWQ